MDKTKLSNKKLKVDDITVKIDVANKESGYEFKGKVYCCLRDIPLPLTQAESYLALGKIKKV